MSIAPTTYCPSCGVMEIDGVASTGHRDDCPNKRNFGRVETETIIKDAAEARKHIGHKVHHEGHGVNGHFYCEDCDVSFLDEPKGSEVSAWVDKAMYEAAPMASMMPRVHLVSATPDPLGAIAAACRMYEGKPTYSLSEISDDERRNAWQQVQDTHLKAPLEFVDLHFFIEGVTRAFTHQMVRQRTAVYAQESMRFAVKLSNPDGDDEFPARPGPMIQQDRGSRQLWESAMRDAWARYEALVANGVPAEEARGVLPHDTLTRLNYKTNLRNLLEHAGNRLCTQAQFEWRMVFIGIVAAVHGYESEYGQPEKIASENGLQDASWQWRHIAETNVFKPVCFSLGHCPFNADFDRGCTIRGRVEDGKFEDIKPEEYMADPTAGWVR